MLLLWKACDQSRARERDPCRLEPHAERDFLLLHTGNEDEAVDFQVVSCLVGRSGWNNTEK